MKGFEFSRTLFSVAGVIAFFSLAGCTTPPNAQPDAATLAKVVRLNAADAKALIEKWHGLGYIYASRVIQKEGPTEWTNFLFPPSIVAFGSVVRVEQLVIPTVPVTLGANAERPTASIRGVMQFDCVNRTRQLLSLRAYSDADAKMQFAANNKAGAVIAIDPGTQFDSMMVALCTGRLNAKSKPPGKSGTTPSLGPV